VASYVIATLAGRPDGGWVNVVVRLPRAVLER